MNAILDFLVRSRDTIQSAIDGRKELWINASDTRIEGEHPLQGGCQCGRSPRLVRDQAIQHYPGSEFTGNYTGFGFSALARA